MAETAELMSLRRAIDDVRSCVAVLRDRHGDIPSVRRLVGDVERLDLDAADLDPAAASRCGGHPAGQRARRPDDMDGR